MSLILWIGLYLGATGMCVWFVLDEGIMAEALFGLHTAKWADRTVKGVTVLTWITFTIWFLFGLMDEAWRLW